MDFTVIEASENYADDWAAMRAKIWPESNCDEHLEEIKKYFSSYPLGVIGIKRAFVAFSNTSGKPVGFIELDIRNYAEGSSRNEVPYIEGWYVESSVRRHGVGSSLIGAAEEWASDLGFDEIASDTEIENIISQNAHLNLGFREASRCVCFIKSI